jgi:hypothetical protein
VPTLTTYYSLTKPDLGQADPSEWGTSVDANFDTIDIELHNRVLLSPGSPQTGSFNLTGNGVLGGDLTTGTLHTGGLSTLGGNVAFSADNTYDIGPGGVSRPRDVTVARDVNVGRNLGVVGTLGVTGTTVLTGGLAGSLAFATDNVYDIGPGGVSRPRDVTAGRDVNVGRNLGVVGDGLVGGTFGVTGLLTASAGIAVAGGQRITLGASGQGLPTFTTVSAGEKVTLFSVIDGTHVNYALGEASNTLWISIPQAVSGYSFSWRGGTTEVMKLDGAGALTVTTLNAGTLLFTDGQISGNLSVGGTFRVNFPNVNQFIVSGDTVTAGIWNGQAILDAYVADDLTIVAGTVNNTPIGATTPATGKFTTLQATGNTTLATVVAGLWNGTIIADAYLSVALAGHTISGGSISGTPISGSTGSFTTLASSGLATLNSLSVTTTLGVTGTSTLGVLGLSRGDDRLDAACHQHERARRQRDGRCLDLPSTIWTSDLGSQAFKFATSTRRASTFRRWSRRTCSPRSAGAFSSGRPPRWSLTWRPATPPSSVKHNNLSTNDTVLLQVPGNTSGCWSRRTRSRRGGYSVNVTRNLAGNGAKLEDGRCRLQHRAGGQRLLGFLLAELLARLPAGLHLQPRQRRQQRHAPRTGQLLGQLRPERQLDDLRGQRRDRDPRQRLLRRAEHDLEHVGVLYRHRCGLALYLRLGVLERLGLDHVHPDADRRGELRHAGLESGRLVGVEPDGLGLEDRQQPDGLLGPRAHLRLRLGLRHQASPDEQAGGLQLRGEHERALPLARTATVARRTGMR